jgi:BMFP domain-containing protein YqiC
MQTDNKLFDDFARMAGGALNALTGVKTEIEAMVRQQFEHFLGNMNLVTREEFEAVQALAAKARDEQESQALRLAAVEAQLAALAGKTPDVQVGDAQ